MTLNKRITWLLWTLQIDGSLGLVGTSNINMNELVYDLHCFKSLTTLEVICYGSFLEKKNAHILTGLVTCTCGLRTWTLMTVGDLTWTCIWFHLVPFLLRNVVNIDQKSIEQCLMQNLIYQYFILKIEDIFLLVKLLNQSSNIVKYPRLEVKLKFCKNEDQ